MKRERQRLQKERERKEREPRGVKTLAQMDREARAALSEGAN